MTRSAKPPMKCSALCATAAVALGMFSLPAVALVSEGTRPSTSSKKGCPNGPTIRR
jgi:hypothetical protein